MPRHISEIAADFDALKARDFGYTNVESDGWERLYRLCEEMRELNDAVTCAPVMSDTMERLDEVELGTPGRFCPCVGIMAWRVRSFAR